MNTIATIKDLQRRAEGGDKVAGETLFTIAFESVYSLKRVALSNPKLLLHLTRKSAGFPALIVPNKSKDAEHAEILKRCEVGGDSTLNINSTAAMMLDTPAKKAAAIAYRAMNQARNKQPAELVMPPELAELCIKLPAPKRDNFKAWRKVLLQILPAAAGDYPADMRASVSPRKNKEGIVKEGDAVDSIKKAISQALFTLLPD